MVISLGLVDRLPGPGLGVTARGDSSARVWGDDLSSEVVDSIVAAMPCCDQASKLRSTVTKVCKACTLRIYSLEVETEWTEPWPPLV